jgi:NTE family protein
VTLVRLTYADQEREVAGKAMDFSPASARVRWDAGLRDGLALVERLASGDIGIGNPGLTIVDPDRDPRPDPTHAFNEVSPSAP